jgi:hypothetical protein
MELHDVPTWVSSEPGASVFSAASTAASICWRRRGDRARKLSQPAPVPMLTLASHADRRQRRAIASARCGD